MFTLAVLMHAPYTSKTILLLLVVIPNLDVKNTLMVVQTKIKIDAVIMGAQIN